MAAGAQNCTTAAKASDGEAHDNTRGEIKRTENESAKDGGQGTGFVLNKNKMLLGNLDEKITKTSKESANHRFRDAENLCSGGDDF